MIKQEILTFYTLIIEYGIYGSNKILKFWNLNLWSSGEKLNLQLSFKYFLKKIKHFNNIDFIKCSCKTISFLLLGFRINIDRQLINVLFTKHWIFYSTVRNCLTDQINLLQIIFCLFLKIHTENRGILIIELKILGLYIM